MSSLLGSIGGTVQGVIGATERALWCVSWHTGGGNAARTAPDRPAG